MASENEITAFQSFTERTIKFGRNMMIAAAPILVFAWVPMVNLGKSHPFNFDIQKGGEIWIWVILLALLLYYAIRFIVLAIIDFLEWQLRHGEVRTNLKTAITKDVDGNRAQLAQFRMAHDEANSDDQRAGFEQNIANVKQNLEGAERKVPTAISEHRIYHFRRIYFWATDVVLPLALFIAAAISASIKVCELWPSCA